MIDHESPLAVSRGKIVSLVFELRRVSQNCPIYPGKREELKIKLYHAEAHHVGHFDEIWFEYRDWIKALK